MTTDQNVFIFGIDAKQMGGVTTTDFLRYLLILNPNKFSTMTRLNLSNSRKIILICNAISNKQLLRFTYHGKERLVEPYVIGQHTINNNFLIRGWECENGEVKKKDTHRKLFSIGKMERLSVEDKDEESNAAFFQGIPRYANIPTCSIYTDAMPARAC